MKRIDQFVHTLSYGDAISGEALTIRRLLREEGFKSDIFVVNKDYRYDEIALSFEHYLEQPDGAVVLHFSIASPLNDLFLQSVNTKRAVIYHNLTPERWFCPYNGRVVRDLRMARDSLQEVVESADLLLGDSKFNLIEISGYKIKEARVLPLVFDSTKWNLPANRGIAKSVKGIEGVNILTVGRMAPNKCLEDILKAFFFYRKSNPKSRLWLVGDDTDTEIYSFELRELIEHLDLKRSVEIVGKVSDDELKAFYETADLYLCMSEHEGFCVPLIEAMYFGLPIVAFDSCAIAETLGDAGVLVQEKNPHVTAQVMEQILSDEQTRSRLVESSKHEIERFSLERFKQRVLKDLVEPLMTQTSDVSYLGDESASSRA